MYTETKEFGIYRFEELPEELQLEIVEKRRDYHVQDEYWFESSIDYWKERLEQLGFEDADVRFSGFWSQGDGASFTAWCDHQKILNTLFMCHEENIGDLKRWRLWFEMVENGPYFRFGVRRTDSRYVHENSIEPYVEEDMSGFTHKIYEAFNEKGQKYYTSIFDERLGLSDLQYMFEDFVRDLCHKIYSELKGEYEYLTSDDFLKQWFKESDETYTVDMETMELV